MLLITAMIWGTAFVAQSKGMEHVQPFTFNAVRTLLGGIVLVPVIASFKHFSGNETAAHSKSATITGGICCGLVLFAASSFQQTGISMTTAGKAGFITALYVIIVPVIELLFGRKIPAVHWICTCAAVAGSYLLCMNDSFSLSKGDLLVLISALFFAVHIIVIDHFNKAGADSAVMSCIQFFTAGLIMLAATFVTESPDIGSIIECRIPILYGGIMSCAVAYTLQIFGQRCTPPALATLLMSLESVFAALSGWLLLNETLTHKEFAGCVLVFSSVAAAQLIPQKIKKDNASENSGN